MKVIAIEGTDASGKETQAKRLVENLKARGIEAEMVSFPRYGEKSSVFVERYLKGEYGTDPKAVDPYTASLFFALDRYDYFKHHKLPEVLVVDRYTVSNMIHQASKFESEEERERFNDWLENFEYERLGIPRPDIIFFLNMPDKKTLELLDLREETDIHEKDSAYLKKAHQYAVELAKEKDWEIIDCQREREILSREKIAEMILERIDERLDV